MNNLKHYDLNNYNFYENNELFKLEFNLEDVIIYELVAGGYIKNEILNEFINQNKNINENIKKSIKKYINNPHILEKEEVHLISEYIKSNSKYVNDLSLWVNFDKLNDQVIADTSRDIKIYKNKNFINLERIISFYKNNIISSRLIKLYLFFTQNFIGFMIIFLIKKIGLDFLKIKSTAKSARIITINENIVTLNLQEYDLELILDDENKKLLSFYYNFKINFSENKFIVEYKCIWDNTFNIKFFKFAQLYSEKVKKIDNNSYSENLTLLLNNKLNSKLRDNLYYIIKSIVNKIDDQSDLNYLNEILKYINNYINKDYDFDSIIFNLLKNEELYNFFKNKNLLNKIYKKIPIKRDEKKSYEKDFLLINFNEEKKSFDDNDCNNIFLKILLEEPSFIIISTQDCNPKGKEHYQHILGEKLKSNKYNILLKNTKDILRMRIYYNTNKVKFNEKEKSRFSSLLTSSQKGGDKTPGFFKKTFVENLSKSSNNSKNLNKNIFLVKKYGIKESTDKKYGHGLVFMRLEISKNNSFTKFIFINCNLSLNKEYEFENIINDFKLLDYWEKGYNIFFSGSFNFTFNPVLYKNTEISKNQSPYLAKPINFIKEYATNNSINKKKSSEKFIKSDKLSIFLENKIKNAKNSFKAVETSFYLNLLSSIEKLGIHPTYKYIKDESTKQEDFYNNIIDYRNKLKDIDTNKQNSYIIKFLNTPDLLEKIKNYKNLVYEYFNIYIQLKLLEEISFRKVEYKSLNSKIHYNKDIQQNIIKTIINMKNKNFINNKIFNELCKKYNLENEKKEIQVMINFYEELNKQKKSSELQKKMNDYINNFIKNKSSFNKVKNNIEKYIEGKDIFYKLNKDCEKFMKNIIDKGLLSQNENNIIIKKRDNLLEKYNKIFNTEANKIIPYQGNRILYILSNHIITDSFDFEVYLFPDKSSYKLTTLSFKIYDKDNIISNRNSTIAVKNENNKNFFKVAFQDNYKENIIEENKEIPEKNEKTPIILGKNNYSSNTNVIPSNIVSNRIKEIEKRKTK